MNNASNDVNDSIFIPFDFRLNRRTRLSRTFDEKIVIRSESYKFHEIKCN